VPPKNDDIAAHFSLLLFRQNRHKTRVAHSTHMDERNATQMIEKNQSRHALLDTLVSVECGVYLEDVLIQSGRLIFTEMRDMPEIPAMRDVRADARHLLPCAIVAPHRRGSFGLGQR
jgi:hypothetical protein